MSWGDIWHFLGSPQFQHIVTAASAIAVFILVPLYRRLRKLVAALSRVPVLEQIIAQHDERIGNLESYRFRQRAGWKL